MNGTGFGFFKSLCKREKCGLHYFGVPLSVLFKNVIFMEAGYRISMENKAVYFKTGSLDSNWNYQGLRKAWWPLHKGGVVSLSPQIKMSFIKPPKFAEKC